LDNLDELVAGAGLQLADGREGQPCLCGNGKELGFTFFTDGYQVFNSETGRAMISVMLLCRSSARRITNFMVSLARIMATRFDDQHAFNQDMPKPLRQQLPYK
jgi:hypothetical protein